MGDYSNMVRNLSKNTKSDRDAAAKAATPSVRKCQYFGCPMKASSIDASGARCTFHDTPTFQEDKTSSIKLNIKWIKAYNDMLHWDSSEWAQQSNWLNTNPNVPREENESNSVWLGRYFSWMVEKIAADADKITKDRLGVRS